MAAVSKYVSDFSIQLSLIVIPGSLVGVKRTGLAKETGFVTVCPTCETPHKMKQGYTCDQGHGPFAIGECLKAKEVSKGVLTFVDAEEIKEARKSDLPANVLDLTVHKATDVDRYTFASDSAYTFYPRVGGQQYGVLMDLVGDPELALLGFCNLRNSEKLLRLHRWGTNLVVQTLWTPEELNERDEMDTEYDPKFSKILDFVRADVTEFDPESYANQQRKRLASITGGDVAARPAPKDDASSLDALLAMLEERSG